MSAISSPPGVGGGAPVYAAPVNTLLASASAAALAVNAVNGQAIAPASVASAGAVSGTTGTFSAAVTASGSVILAAGTGANSALVGIGNTAAGADATSIGRLNTASGAYSLAEGYNNIASGASSFALGISNTASGTISLTLGAENIASGGESTAVGRSNTASGAGSSAFGVGVKTATGSVQEIGKWAGATREGAVRIHGGTGMVAMTVQNRATEYDPFVGTAGAEPDNQLAPGMFAIRRNGLNFILDYNDAGTIKNISLGTAA